MPIQTTPCLPSTNTEHLACAFTQVAGSGDSLVRPLMRLPVQAHGFPLGELKLFPGASISLHIAVISGPWDVLRPLALDRSLLSSHSAVISRDLTKLGGVTFHPWSHSTSTSSQKDLYLPSTSATKKAEPSPFQAQAPILRLQDPEFGTPAPPVTSWPPSRPLLLIKSPLCCCFTFGPSSLLSLPSHLPSPALQPPGKTLLTTLPDLQGASLGLPYSWGHFLCLLPDLCSSFCSPNAQSTAFTISPGLGSYNSLITSLATSPPFVSVTTTLASHRLLQSLLTNPPDSSQFCLRWLE